MRPARAAICLSNSLYCWSSGMVRAHYMSRTGPVRPARARDWVIFRTEVIRKMTGGQLLVECLVRHGVEVVFGIPGAHTMAIYDALYRHPKIKHILVRHEQSAALMADGYARPPGKPAACGVTTGPGETNPPPGRAGPHAN